MPSPVILSQVLVGIAFCIDLAAFQFKKRAILIACFAASAICMSAHFYLLQRYTAAILALVIFIRLVVALKYPRREIAYIFMVVAVLSAYFTWQGGISALALLGVLLGTWGTFQPNDKSVRLWLLPASGAWLIHNILIVSPAACVIELFSICSNVVGFRRYYGINDKLGGSNCPSTVASKNR